MQDGACQEKVSSSTQRDDLRNVFSSTTCFGSGGLWLPPNQLPDYSDNIGSLTPKMGYGWTCVDTEQDPPQLLDHSFETCYTSVCGQKITDLDAAYTASTVEAEACWKPVYFNPCNDCTALLLRNGLSIDGNPIQDGDGDASSDTNPQPADTNEVPVPMQHVGEWVTTHWSTVLLMVVGVCVVGLFLHHSIRSSPKFVMLGADPSA